MKSEPEKKFGPEYNTYHVMYLQTPWRWLKRVLQSTRKSKTEGCAFFCEGYYGWIGFTFNGYSLFTAKFNYYLTFICCNVVGAHLSKPHGLQVSGYLSIAKKCIVRNVGRFAYRMIRLQVDSPTRSEMFRLHLSRFAYNPIPSKSRLAEENDPF